MNLNPAAIRNIAIVMGIAALVFVSQRGFGAVAVSLNQIIFILFIAGIAVFAYQYFRENRLAWMVIPEGRRKLLIACGVGILLLLTIGIPVLGPHITVLGVIALAAALGLVIAWIIRESRRFR
jgi:hypothetical protein